MVQQQAAVQNETPADPVVPIPESTDMLQNPARVPKKGRPSEKEKRRKTLLEQRDDEQKKKTKKEEAKQVSKRKPRAKKTDIECKYCGGGGHSVQDCEYLKAATAASSKCPFCNEVGHTVQQCVYLIAKMENDAAVARATQLKL